MFRTRLSFMGIICEDQRGDIAQTTYHYLSELSISPTIAYCIREAKVDYELPEQWIAQGTQSFRLG